MEISKNYSFGMGTTHVEEVLRLYVHQLDEEYYIPLSELAEALAPYLATQLAVTSKAKDF